MSSQDTNRWHSLFAIHSHAKEFSGAHLLCDMSDQLHIGLLPKQILIISTEQSLIHFELDFQAETYRNDQNERRHFT